jgi:hypothetical protein
MKAVAHDGAPTAAHHAAIIDRRKGAQAMSEGLALAGDSKL